jgi:uncharacterized membrane protein (UPF0127 family)
MLVRSFVNNYRFLHFADGAVISAQLARTSQQQQKGLMFVEQLPDNEGMLFEYNQPQALSFWMKNTPLPLSVAFIDYVEPRLGTIVDIQHMEPYSLMSHRSSKFVHAALEVKQGWFQQHNIHSGDYITW